MPRYTREEAREYAEMNERYAVELDEDSDAADRRGQSAFARELRGHAAFARSHAAELRAQAEGRS